MQRRETLGAFSGALAFPGGKVTARDSGAAIRRRTTGAEALDDEMLAFHVSAVRELFEEAGILFARHEDGRLLDAAGVRRLWPSRARLDSGEEDLAELLARERLHLALDLFTPFARWVTPVVAKRRFDALFLLAPAPEGQVEEHDGGEMEEAVWMRPADAIVEADSKRRMLVFATRCKLDLLSTFPSAAAALTAARTTPVVTVSPEWCRTPEGPKLRIPADAGYRITEGDPPPLPGGSRLPPGE